MKRTQNAGPRNCLGFIGRIHFGKFLRYPVDVAEAHSQALVQAFGVSRRWREGNNRNCIGHFDQRSLQDAEIEPELRNLRPTVWYRWQKRKQYFPGRLRAVSGYFCSVFQSLIYSRSDICACSRSFDSDSATLRSSCLPSNVTFSAACSNRTATA